MMKRVLYLCLVLLFAGGTVEASAQGWLKKLGKTVENAAKNAVERNAERKTEDAVDKVFNGEIGISKNDNQNDNNNADTEVRTQRGDVATQSAQPQPQSLEMTYAKSDFVPGDEIMFDDNQANEKLGEFPSMWDLKGGNAEVVSVGGANAIHLASETTLIPYMKEKDYLPEEFTIEFDLYVPCENTEYNGGKDPDLGMNNRYDIELLNAAGKVVFEANWYNGNNRMGVPREIDWNWLNGGEELNGIGTAKFNMSDFNHIAISFNKRALKFYVNGVRIANIPRCDAPTRFQIYSYSGIDSANRFIKNVRIAKGAVPLYDRMMSDGKFITYGITFDVGKATIKPESMGEINRIVQLMNENPTLKFSVEGHTDATGKPESNQTLSEQRSKAIVDKLVELGITQDRLTAVGKGQNNPIADNTTDEGRAKNRRVEFVKI